MGKKIFWGGILFLILFCWIFGCERKKEVKVITVSGAWALYPMMVKWSEEYQNLHSEVKIDISAGGAGKGMADVLGGMVDIGMVSREIYPEEVQRGAFYIAVVKDAVVVTVNEKNPFLKELGSRGVKRSELQKIWVSGEIKDWGELVGRSVHSPVSVYTRSDACGAGEVWAKFLGVKQEDLRGVGVYGDPGVAQAVRSDVLGIGYNNIGYAYDYKSGREISGIRVLGIDLDEDGVLEMEEDFYSSLDKLKGAIADGRYPSPPARELYLVFKGSPKKSQVLEFVKWILKDGQEYVSEAGYIRLSSERLREELGRLD